MDQKDPHEELAEAIEAKLREVKDELPYPFDYVILLEVSIPGKPKSELTCGASLREPRQVKALLVRFLRARFGEAWLGGGSDVR